MEIANPGGRSKGIMSVAALSILQSILRLYFSYLGTTGGIKDFLTAQVSSATLQFINVVFLLLGVAGLITAYGLWQKKKWGYWGTILVSVLTILFDVWGLTIQSTAALVFVFPALSISLLTRIRSQFV